MLFAQSFSFCVIIESSKEILSNGDVIHDLTDSEYEYIYHYYTGIGVIYRFGPKFDLSA